MDARKLFSYSGRVGRQEYWLTYLVATLVYGMLVGFGSLLSKNAPVIGFLIVVPAAILYPVVTWLLTFKRLHDTDRSGWWLLKFIAVMLGLGLLGALVSIALPRGPVIVLFGLSLLAGIGYNIWVVGLQPSDTSDNRYGAPHSGSVFAR